MEHRILVVGLGDLGSRTLDLLTQLPGRHAFLVGGRNVDYLQERANLSLLTAIQLGYTPDITSTFLDLEQIDQTAETIARFRPDIIICTASLRRWGTTKGLPTGLTEKLASAPMGPRLPLYLTLVYKLMQAVRATGQTIKVINAMYPDVVNPVLEKVGLAPTTGIGDLANNIPALRKSLAITLRKPLEAVDVRLVMARYVSYWMSRRSIQGLPFSFTALIDDEDQTHLLNKETIFSALPTTLKRVGGPTGLLMTATSAVIVVKGLVESTDVIAHAPAPNGLPGGYPVRVNAQGVEVVLPGNLTLEEAIQLNEAGLRLDGIQQIESNGTVSFTEVSMAIFKEVLGYECMRMSLAETEDWARELQSRYTALVSRHL